MPDVRWLQPQDAAAYIGVRASALRRLVKQGRVPAPSYQLGPRTPRYDREALDRAMNGDIGLLVTDADAAFSALAQEILRNGALKRGRKPRRG